MKTLTRSTPVVTTFYAKENVFGFVASAPKTKSYMEDGTQVDETHYLIELVDGSELRVEDIHLEEVDPENMPDHYEMSVVDRSRFLKQTKIDNEVVNLTVAFSDTNKDRNETRNFAGTRKEVNSEISNFAEMNMYNSYSTTTNKV